jgi:hypothetical protein
LPRASSAITIEAVPSGTEPITSHPQRPRNGAPVAVRMLGCYGDQEPESTERICNHDDDLQSVSVSCGLAIGAAADAVPAGGDYGEPRLLVASPDDPAVAHLSWPKIVTTGDGTLVLAYSAGKGHNIGGSGPAVSRSTDGGATFSRPQVLIRFPDDDARYRDCGNMALGIAGDGSVVLLAMAYAGNTQNTILGWRSTDDGATWTRVDTTALADNKTGSVYGHILQVPQVAVGKLGQAPHDDQSSARPNPEASSEPVPFSHSPGKDLVVFGHYRQPSRPASGIWMSVSRDHGMTWEPPRVVTEKAYFEPAFTLLRAGSSACCVCPAMGKPGGTTRPFRTIWARLVADPPVEDRDPRGTAGPAAQPVHHRLAHRSREAVRAAVGARPAGREPRPSVPVDRRCEATRLAASRRRGEHSRRGGKPGRLVVSLDDPAGRREMDAGLLRRFQPRCELDLRNGLEPAAAPMKSRAGEGGQQETRIFAIIVVHPAEARAGGLLGNLESADQFEFAFVESV